MPVSHSSIPEWGQSCCSVLHRHNCNRNYQHHDLLFCCLQDGKPCSFKKFFATALASNDDIAFFEPVPERSCKSEPMLRFDPFFGDEPDLGRRPKSITFPIGCAAKGYQIDEGLRQELVKVELTARQFDDVPCIQGLFGSANFLLKPGRCALRQQAPATGGT